MTPVGRPRRLWIAGAVVVILAAVSVLGWLAYSRATAHDVAKARAGDCVGNDREQEPPTGSCCAVPPAPSSPCCGCCRATGAAECPRVAGAALWFTAGERIACLGKKGVDPATAVNVAQEGDCLQVEGAGRDRQARRERCGSTARTPART